MKIGATVAWAAGFYIEFKNRRLIFSTLRLSMCTATRFRSRSIISWKRRCCQRRPDRHRRQGSLLPIEEAMPVEITMPQLSDTMSEGTVVKWRKKEKRSRQAGRDHRRGGDRQSHNGDGGLRSRNLATILAKEGEKVGVGKVMAVLATASEKVDEIRQKYAQGAPVKSAPAKTEAAESAAPLLRPRKPTAVATAPPPPAPSKPAAPTGDNGNRPMRVSPLARRIAQDKGVDLSQIQGSGPSGASSSAMSNPPPPAHPSRPRRLRQERNHRTHQDATGHRQESGPVQTNASAFL